MKTLKKSIKNLTVEEKLEILAAAKTLGFKEAAKKYKVSMASSIPGASNTKHKALKAFKMAESATSAANRYRTGSE